MQRSSVLLGLAILILIPLGLLTKAYRGPAAFWVNNSLSGTLYVVFWCWVVAFVKPYWKKWKIVLGVLAVTCFLEVLQLWHPPFLTFIRSFYWGKVLIGTSFAWSDFPHYVAGALLGYLTLKKFQPN